MSRANKIFGNWLFTTSNRDGFPAYERPLAEQYLQTLMTNTLGNTYYADGEELLQEAMDIHTRMMAEDPEFASRALVFARNEGLMRLQPLLGLAYLSKADTGLFSRVFNSVIQIPSDLADFLTILSGLGRGQGGRAVKREVAGFLNIVNEYWALKYNGRGRGYSLGDAVATTHPKPVNERQKQIFRYLTGQEADLSDLPQIAAFESLKLADTVEEQISLITGGRLPHEIVTGAIKPGREIWNAILPQMPVFALLRNLNTLDRAGVLDENREYITGRLTSREILQKSKIMPFRFINAFENVKSDWVRDVLRQAVELTFDNLPDIPGKTAIFLDISGSMNGEYLRTGSVFALALFKKTLGNAIFWLFDTEVEEARASMHDSILTQAERIYARGGTDTGAPMRKLTAKKEKVDNIILITDEQQNTGSPFYGELKAYRKKVNPEARAFIIDIAPYRTAVVPPVDQLTYYIYGWSDTVLQYISYAINGYGDMAGRVRSMEI